MLAAAAVAVGLAAPLALAAATDDGHAPRFLEQSSGTAWVVSPARGLLTLLDGASRHVVVGVSVPGAGRALSVAQTTAGAYLVDDDAGTVSRLDAARFTASTPVGLGTPGGGLTVLQGDPGPGRPHVVHVLDPQARTAARVDPRTLAVQDEVTLTARPGPGQALVDGTGDLWALDAATGTVTRVAAHDGSRTVRRTESATATARLVLVRGAPVLVDAAAGAAHVLGADARPGPARCVDTRPPDDVEVLGSTTRDEVYVAVAQARALLVTPTASDDCGRAIDLTGPGGDARDDEAAYGALAQSGRYVFVPDRTTGTAVVVDTVAGTVLDHVALADPGHRVELRAQAGFVFYNDLDGHRAGVLTQQGTRWSAASVDKYDPATGEAAEVVAPEDERPPVTPPGEDAARTDDAPSAGPRPSPPTPSPGARATQPTRPGPTRSPVGTPTAGPTPSPGSSTGPPLTVALATDPAQTGQPEIPPYAQATVVATVTGASSEATWDWDVSSAATEQAPQFTPPARGAPLVLDSVGSDDVTVRLTVTDGARTASAELLLWVTYACHGLINGFGSNDGHVVDLTAVASDRFTVEGAECRVAPTVTVTVLDAPWLEVSPTSLVAPTDGSRTDVTVTQVGASSATGTVRVTFSGTREAATYDVLVLPDAAPTVVDATVCTRIEALRDDGRTVGTRYVTTLEAVVLDAVVGGAARHTVTGNDGRTLTYWGPGGGSGEHVYRVHEEADTYVWDTTPRPVRGPASVVTATDGWGGAGSAGTRAVTGC